ncbi:MAG TPA: MFS transporter [Candidatus Cloacimonadota bacterium]|nr:MFS transporter [Candidatus Cloacimonadota bacterium]
MRKTDIEPDLTGSQPPARLKLRRAPRTESIVTRTYRISITESIFSQIYGTLATIGSSFITKLLVILGASPLHYSLLSALGQASAVFQPLGVAITHRLKRRKPACIWITALGRILTFFLGLSLLFSIKSSGIWFVLALLFASAGLQAIGGNIWIAWVSELIPLSLRGRFFSKRNQYMLFYGLIVSYLVSFHVDLFEKSGSGLRSAYVKLLGLQDYFTPANQAIFLSGVFIAATLISLFGLTILARQPERKLNRKPTEKLSRLYREPFKDKNFRLLLIFGVWWMFSIGVGSAFWGPFMLKKLQMGLFEVQLYSSVHMIFSLIGYNFWGRFIDRFGNKTAMKICVFLGGMNPMLWLFMTAQNHTILWFEAVTSGFMWAGAGIVTTNFALSLAAKGREQVYSGTYNAIVGVGMMASTLLTGIFFPPALKLGSLALEPEQVVFGVGGIMRWLTIIPLMLVVENRSVPLRQAMSGVRQSLMLYFSNWWKKE